MEQQNQTIVSKEAAKPVGFYPHAKWVGPTLYLSGIGPRRQKDNSIPETFEEQCHSVFDNVKAVLSSSNLSLEHLVDVTVFLTNMKKDFASFNQIYASYFPLLEKAPCRTTVEVVSLPTPIDIELKCIAFKA